MTAKPDDISPQPSPVVIPEDELRARVMCALESVSDPEIPVISVVDMGMIASVRFDNAAVHVDVTPTFAACPAIALICEQIRGVVSAVCEGQVHVHVVFDPPWTSERITASGRERLHAFGLAPPQSSTLPMGISGVRCPFCGSDQTDLDSIFGPTLCRSMHYCRECRQSFEHFKPVG